MLDHISIEVFGLLRGTADGPLAVVALALIVLAVVAALKCAVR
jgi:hypothetical protein